MVAEDDRGAGRGALEQQRAQSLAGIDIEAREGLIEDDEVGLSQEGLDEKHLSLRARRQLSEPLREQVGEAQAARQHGRLLLGGAVVEPSKPRMMGQVPRRRERRRRRLLIRGIPGAQAGRCGPRVAGWLSCADEQAKKSRLARAVGASKLDHGSRRHVEIQVPQHPRPASAIALADRLQGHGRGRAFHLSLPHEGRQRRKPPSELITCPVIQRASSQSSHATSRAASSGLPQRPAGKRSSVEAIAS